MKILVQKENKVVVATGNYGGKKIKAVVVCREPVFDEEFGIKLAKIKYKTKQYYTKMREYEKEIKELKRVRNWIDNKVSDLEKFADAVDLKVQSGSLEYEDIVRKKFNL